MYKLVKHFTSRDGRLQPDDRPYGITAEGIAELGDAAPHLGGATHIFVKTVGGPSNEILFSSRDGQYVFKRAEKAHGWAEFELSHGNASYIPDRGEIGWWSAQVASAPSEIVEGIGLPYSWHVSTFLVFAWSDAGSELPEVPDEGGPDIPDQPAPSEKFLRMEFSIAAQEYAAIVRLYSDGTYDLNEIGTLP